MKALLAIYKQAYQKKYLFYSVLAILFMIADIIISLLIPYFSKRIIDEALPTQNLSLVYEVGILVVGIAFAAVLCTVFNNITSQYISTSLTDDLRRKLFMQIQHLSLHQIDELSTGKLMTMVTNDTTQIQHTILLFFRALLRAPITLVGAIVMAYITNQDLFLVILICVPILIIGFVYIFKKASPRFKIIQKRIDDINTQLSQTVEGAREIKAFVSELEEMNQFQTDNEAYHQATVRANKIIVAVSPMVNMVSNIGIGVILYLASWIISKGSNTSMAGSIMTYIAYVQQIIMSLMMISNISIMISRSMVSADRIEEVLKLKTESYHPTDISREIIGDIVFRDVCFSYADQKDTTMAMTLNHINLHIKAKERVGIIGSTGSGKSTLVQLLPRMYEATSGVIEIDQIPIASWNRSSLRRQISYVTQEAVIFEDSISNNIKQGKQDAGSDEVIRAAKLAQADEFIQQMKEGYDSMVAQEGMSLSGGQRQRLSIARALIRNPKILILDDSVSAVDAKTEEALKNAFHEIKDTTIIMIAQKVSSIRDMDKIIVLSNKGTIDGIGTHQELLKNSAVYQEIVFSQTGGNGNEC